MCLWYVNHFRCLLLQPRSVEQSRNSRSMENLDRSDRPTNHVTSSQNRRTSVESGPNQSNPDQKPVKKRSSDESGRRERKSSSNKSDSPAASSSASAPHKTRSSGENRRSRTEVSEPSAARSSAVLQSTINPLLTDVRLPLSLEHAIHGVI